MIESETKRLNPHIFALVNLTGCIVVTIIALLSAKTHTALFTIPLLILIPINYRYEKHIREHGQKPKYFELILWFGAMLIFFIFGVATGSSEWFGITGWVFAWGIIQTLFKYAQRKDIEDQQSFNNSDHT